MKTVLSLCDLTGNMLKPWAKAGYRCIAVDLARDHDYKKDGIEFISADVRCYLPPRVEYAACFAFPPCDDMAVSGARWFKDKGLYAISGALDLVETCRRICEWTDAPWCLENPVSTLATYWRKPNYQFDPCDFGGYLIPAGDPYNKRTCLWTGGGFTLPPIKRVDPTEGSKMHTQLRNANDRSASPNGFAQAVFEHLSARR